MLQEDAQDQGLDEFGDDLKRIEDAGRQLLKLLDAAFEAGALGQVGSANVDETGVAIAGSAQLAKTLNAGAPPLSNARRPAIKTTSPRSLQRSLGGRILVVDDLPANRDMISRRLEHHGFVVDLAEGGQQAIEMIANTNYDLVILDVMMPEVSGLDVLREVRSRHDAADLPVIMATARDASEDVVEALNMGANDYVTKPLDFAVVLARMNTHLGLKQAKTKIHELSERLEQAQHRIAGLADAPQSPGDTASGLAVSISREVGEALGNAEVVIWLFKHEQLNNVTGGELSQPNSAELELLRNQGRVYRDAAALISVRGQSGKLYGVLGVAPNEEVFGEAEEHMVTNLARHLASTLELSEMRRELARTAEQRQATQQDLVARGIDLLHLCPVCNRCYSQNVNLCQADGYGVHPTARPFPYRVSQRYRLVRLVGEGGMGTVFRAHDERLDREVAIKLVKGEHFHNETVRIRFQNEARAVARIEHPAVIKIFDSGEAEDGSLFMVMEWLQGKDLGMVLDEQGPGAPTQVASMLRQVSGALAAAHSANLVHRDIKPDNIFVNAGPDGLQFKVLDFGVAKEISRDTKLTETGGLVGTPLYMSPEQLMNRPVDARSDTYSLSAVAYEALTGRRTVNAEQFAEVVLAVATKDAPRLSDAIPGLDPRLDQAFSRGLSKLPEHRPERVDQWVSEFVHLLEELPPLGCWEL